MPKGIKNKQNIYRINIQNQKTKPLCNFILISFSIRITSKNF